MDTVATTPAPAKEPLYAEPPPPAADSEKLRLQELSSFFGYEVQPLIGEEAPLVPETPAAPVDPNAPAAPAPAAVPAPAAAPATPPAPAAREPKRLPDPSEIARKAIEDAARSLAPATPAAPAPAPNPEDRALELRIAALELLKEEPEFAGRDLAAEYKGYLGKLDAYETQWKAKNPGESFDLDASEHDQWKEKNEPEIDEEVVRGAEIEVKAIRRVEAKFSQRDSANVGARIMDEARAKAVEAAGQILNFREGLQADSLEALEDKDVIAALVVEPLIARAADLVATVTSLLTPGTPAVPDMRIGSHRAVMDAVRGFESRMMEIPAEQRVDGYGRQYCPETEYEKLTPTEKQQRWTFRYAPEEMRALVIADIRRQANAQYDRKTAKKGAAPAAPVAASPAPATTAAASPTLPPTPQPRPPSGGSGPATIPGGSPAGPGGGFRWE